MHRLRRAVPALLICLLLATALPWGLPAFLALAQEARAMLVLPMEERRRASLGPWYRDAEALRLATPERTRVDVVLAHPRHANRAMQAGAALHLRDVRYFHGWDAWRRRDEARFLTDSRAANAVPGTTPPPAAIVVWFDPDVPHPFRVVTPPAP